MTVPGISGSGRDTVKFFKLLTEEGEVILERIRLEKKVLNDKIHKIVDVPQNWKKKPTCILVWIFENIVRRKFVIDLGQQVVELDRIETITNSHVGCCRYISKNYHDIPIDVIVVTLDEFLISWYTAKFLPIHQKKFVWFSVRVRLHNIRQLKMSLQ